MNYEIYLDGEWINTIWAPENFVKQYCAENGYTYALRAVSIETAADSGEELSQLDMIEAQVAYTAMMTDTLLEV